MNNTYIVKTFNGSNIDVNEFNKKQTCWNCGIKTNEWTRKHWSFYIDIRKDHPDSQEGNTTLCNTCTGCDPMQEHSHSVAKTMNNIIVAKRMMINK